jgi:2-polyprenyl-6-methoxyphenol hydroxylase-like FAD-dependent oxidoreductase
MKSQIEHARTPILIVGGGPVGSLLALSLSHFHQPCALVEASLTTTPWPKMEQINGRTMEVLRILGLAEKLRNTRGVPKADAPWTVLHYTGLGDLEPEFSRVVCLNHSYCIQMPSNIFSGSSSLAYRRTSS